MGKPMLLSLAVFCAAVVTASCAATSVDDKKLITKRQFKDSSMQGYPPRTQGHPPHVQGHPPRAQGYPPRAQGYPPRMQGHPPRAQGYPPRVQGYLPYNNMAMEEQYDNKLAMEEQYDNKLALEEQYDNKLAMEEQYDNKLAMEEQYDNQIAKEEQRYYDNQIAKEEQYDNQLAKEEQRYYDNQIAMEEQYDNQLAMEEQFANKLAMEEQFANKLAMEEQYDNELAMEEQFANKIAMEEQHPLIAKEEQHPLLAKEEQFARMELARRGLAYVRWGRTTCPAGAELVYAGRAAGSHYTHRGGGSNYQCVTLTPENFDFGAGTVAASFMYGSEYEMWGNVPQSSLPLNNHDVPCAVCYVTARTAKIMIPGTYKCPAKWTREYYGYLMAERYSHHRSTFECMDKDAEPAKGGHANHNGALFYHVEPRCGSLPCPPYDQQKEMTCAVCTR